MITKLKTQPRNGGSRPMSRGRAVAARVAHNHKVGGSSPPPATKFRLLEPLRRFFCYSEFMKTTKESVAIVILDENGDFLAVKRADDDSFAGHWGLPAATVRNGETKEDTAKRAAKDKLGVDIKVLGLVGDMSLDKGEYISHLTEYRVNIPKGDVSLEARDPSVSHYVEYKYCDDPSILIPAAKAGSVCSRIFLKSKGLSWD